MKTSRALLLGITFATTAWLTSCGATGEVGAGLETPLPLGGHLELGFRISFGGNTTAEITSSRPLCLEVCFSGSDGADLGCTTIEVPGSAQVPAGAVRWEATIVDCPDGDSGESAAMFGPALTQGPQNPPSRQAIPIPSESWEMLGGMVYPIADGTTNVTYSFHVRATNLAAAKVRRDDVLAAGIGTAVGAGFDVVYYSESEAELDSAGLPTGVRMRQGEAKDDFATYSLTVNGTVFAELGVTSNLLHYSASGQWDVVETFVPTSAFETTAGTFDNTATANWTTLNTPFPWNALQRVYAD